MIYDGGSFERLRKRHLYRISVIGGFSAFLVFSILFSISNGSLKLSFIDIIKILLFREEGNLYQIIVNIRLPRTLVACFVGMCLALSGTILQSIMKNPLASPNIIGVTSGAGAAVWVILIIAPQFYALLIPAAFIGAFLATLIIYFLAWNSGVNPNRLILSGVAVSAFLGSLINTLMILYPDRVQLVVGFMVGGLSARGWRHFHMIYPYALAGLVLSFIFSKRINILALGDDAARGLGVKVEETRMILIVIASLLAGSAVSIVGLLGFVGLIVPHAARILIGNDHRYLVFASSLLGAGFLVFCDTLSRVLFDPVEIPVGIITAMSGSPFFLYILKKGFKK